MMKNGVFVKLTSKPGYLIASMKYSAVSRDSYRKWVSGIVSSRLIPNSFRSCAKTCRYQSRALHMDLWIDTRSTVRVANSEWLSSPLPLFVLLWLLFLGLFSYETSRCRLIHDVCHLVIFSSSYFRLIDSLCAVDGREKMSTHYTHVCNFIPYFQRTRGIKSRAFCT